MDIDLEFVLMDNSIYSVSELCVLVVMEVDDNMELVESCVKLIDLSLCRRWFLRFIENNINFFVRDFIFWKF